MLIYMSTTKDENVACSPFALEGRMLEPALSEANGMRVIYEKSLCPLTLVLSLVGERRLQTAIF